MSTIDKLQYKRAISKGEEFEQAPHEIKTWGQRIKEVMTGRMDQPVDIWWLFPTDITNELCIEHEFF